MKLLPVFVFALSEGKKLHDPPKQLKRLRRNIQFVWDEWYAPVCHENRKGKFDRLTDLVDRMEVQYDKCGFFDSNLPNGGPAAGRRRRDTEKDTEKDVDFEADEDPMAWITDPFYGDNSDMDSDTDGIGMRLSKNDRGKAAKQLGNIIRRFGQRYLADCKYGLTVKKLEEKGKKWTKNLNSMSCIQN